LCVEDLAECAAVADTLDLAVEEHLRIVLCQHIDGIALLKRADEGNAFCHRSVCGAFAEDMQSLLKATDGVGGVLVEVVGQDDGIHFVLNKGIKVAIDSNILANRLAHILPSFFAEVAGGNDLTVEKHKHIQTVMRKVGMDRPYERLKELTRGRRVNAKIMQEFVRNLPLPKADKDRLLKMTPASYVGLAAKLAKLA
ncbi:MAG: hypothetical protein IIW14_05185, partial [Kiritimatiellae bacterium]|nr:hypothetical protein [Kiritimatiellia bacterium]